MMRDMNVSVCVWGEDFGKSTVYGLVAVADLNTTSINAAESATVVLHITEQDSAFLYTTQ